MSRSNPTSDSPNPCTRWHEWNGEKGHVKYYDKEKKENVDLALPFTFIVLDELAVIKGWHESSESGITSNEVRDVRKESMTVKAFKGGPLAEGFYTQIKDKVAAAGGHYVANLYVAFKSGDALALGSLQFKGAALGAWMDFRKAHRKDILEQAIQITGFDEGKKGRVIFRTPKFKLLAIKEETNTQAVEIDKGVLQPYLADYFKRTRVEQVAQPQIHDEDENRYLPTQHEPEPPEFGGEAEEDDIPF
ncbi:MAG TPA: hypothetical protein VMQ76_13275 [Terracidiphilus sp.]|nr:hypothetical protein [Terracidiphilus sp.]